MRDAHPLAAEQRSPIHADRLGALIEQRGIAEDRELGVGPMRRRARQRLYRQLGTDPGGFTRRDRDLQRGAGGGARHR